MLVARVAHAMGRPTRRCRSVEQRSRGSAAWAGMIALLVAGACAPPREDDLFGLDLDIRSQQRWAARDPELRRRLHDLLERSCAHMGLDPSLLYGMTLRIEDDAIACGAVDGARGCTWRDDGVVVVSTLAWLMSEPPVPCVEDTPIPHELLHVKIGDAHHLDPRWRDSRYWGPLWESVTRADCSGYPPILIW
jgi:hypothetical protein